MNTTFMPFVHDVTMVVPYFYSPRNCLRLIEQERCTVRYGTDAMYQMELGLDEFESFDLQLTGTWVDPRIPGNSFPV